MKLAIKIDIDTLKGYLEGLPRLMMFGLLCSSRWGRIIRAKRYAGYSAKVS